MANSLGLGNPACCCTIPNNGGGGGGCSTFVITVNDTNCSPIPGLTVGITSYTGSTLASGTTDGSGSFTWTGTPSYLPQAYVITPSDDTSYPGAKVPQSFTQSGSVCTAAFTMCRVQAEITIEDGGVLTYEDCTSPECIEPSSGCTKEGSTYTYINYLFGYGSCVRIIPGSYGGQACQSGYWGCCDSVQGICGQTVTLSIKMFSKTVWNHHLGPACYNDRRLVIPKTLYVTNSGTGLVLGGNSGRCVPVNWTPGSWDGDPCTVQLHGLISRMSYGACIDAGGAYGMCTPRGYGDGTVAGQEIVPYGSAAVGIDFPPVPFVGELFGGLGASYRVYFNGSCHEENAGDPGYPQCGTPDYPFYAHQSYFCQGDLVSDDGLGNPVHTLIYIFNGSSPYPGYALQYAAYWQGAFCTFSSETFGMSPINITSHSYPGYGAGAGGWDGLDSPNYPGATCYQPPSSVSISESCGSYGTGGSYGGGTDSLHALSMPDNYRMPAKITRKAPSRELAVIRFKEDVSWCSKVPFPTVIYNRGDHIDVPGVQVVADENLGREAGGMLHHIISHYHNLADITFFCQGEPHNATIDEFLGRLELDYSEPVSMTARYTDVFPAQHIKDRDTSVFLGGYESRYGIVDPVTTGYCDAAKLPTAELWEAFFTCPMPVHDQWVFGYGAQWAIPRANILARPIEFWQWCYEEVCKTDSTFAGHLYSAWSFEMVWKYLFDPAYTVKLPVKPPGLWTMAKNFASAAGKQVLAGNPIASQELQDKRKAICYGCPLLDKVKDKCNKCGCTNMDLKRRWETSKCPEGLW